MKLKTLAGAAAGIALAFPALATAHAGTYGPGCTTEPQMAWKSVDTSVVKAVALGYTISKTKITGSCHEIYVTKDGRRFELFFNPVTNDLIHTAAK